MQSAENGTAGLPPPSLAACSAATVIVGAGAVGVPDEPPPLVDPPPSPLDVDPPVSGVSPGSFFPMIPLGSP